MPRDFALSVFRSWYGWAWFRLAMSNSSSAPNFGCSQWNLPPCAIQEFQISQSMLDLTTELTSSGAVNVATETGTRQFHGEGFYNFRDDSTAAKVRSGVPFQRSQFGGRFGGPVIADKLFFFLAGERTKQDLVAPVALSPPFSVLDANFRAPFRETETMGRLDWQIRPDWRAFYRFSYDKDSVVATFLPNTFQPFNNRNHTPLHALGLDFTTGGGKHRLSICVIQFRNNNSH